MSVKGSRCVAAFFCCYYHFFIGIKTIITTKTKIYSSGKTSVSKNVDETADISYTEHYECVFCGEKIKENTNLSAFGSAGRRFAEKHGLKSKDEN